MESTDRSVNIHFAPFSLYRHMIEATDGIQVLLGNSCVVASQPLIRVSFESHLQLIYLLSFKGDAFAKKSLSYLSTDVLSDERSIRKHEAVGEAYAEFQ